MDSQPWQNETPAPQLQVCKRGPHLLMRWQLTGGCQCTLQLFFRLFPSLEHIIDGRIAALFLYDGVCPPLLIGNFVFLVLLSKGFSFSPDSSDSRSQMSDLLLVSQSRRVAGLR